MAFMNQKQESDKQLEEKDVVSVDPARLDKSSDSLDNQENQVVYIAELNGEFFTVDYNNNDDDPTVTPLKIVEFVNSAPDNAIKNQLISTEDDAPSQLKPLENSQLTSESKQLKGKPSTKKGIFIGIALGLLAAWIGTKVLFPASTESANNNAVQDLPVQKRSVTVASVDSNIIDRSIEVSGTVEALELIPVTSQLSGLQIQEILVDEGSIVESGQVLARLKNDTIQAEYMQAQAAVEGAKARLAELQAGTRSEEIARAQQRVNSATASVDQAESDLDLVSKRVERNRNLEAEGAISRDRLDEINNQQRISRANLSQAEASLLEATQELKQLQAGPRPEIISQARAELAQAQAQLQYASVQLNNTVIEAVTNGKIAERNAKVGDLTSASQTLFTIIEDGSLELQLQVPETDLNRIEPGQKVVVGSNNAPIIGRVREIDPIVDRNSRQAIVKVNLPSDDNLKPGMFLEAAITTSKNQAITVPIKALLPQIDDRAIAYVLQPDNTVEARDVIMGDILSGDQIEVVRGLETGEKIIVKGATYLKDGDAVSVTNELFDGN